MTQLSTLEAGFLQAEDSDPHVSLAIGGLTVIEGPMPDFDQLAATMTERLMRMPRARQVVRTHRLDLGPPEWVDKPDLDLSHHIRHAALPAPGDDDILYRFVADVVEQRLDRDHPLWECWVVEGLPEGRWAVLVKLHHCIADGIAATRMVAGLGDDGTATTSFVTELNAAHKPERTWSAPGISANPIDWARSAWAISGAAAGLGVQVVKGTVGLFSGLLNPATQSSLTGSVSTLRRYRAARVALSDMDRICRAFDVTLNDVALAAITHGYREVLLSRGEKPDRNSLRTLVPVSVRGDDALDESDNRVSAMLPLLPVDRANPLDQLRIVHRRMTKAKSSGQRQAGSSMLDATMAIPYPMTAWALRTLTRLPQRGVVAVATNVPGPRQQVRVLGRDVLRIFPIPPIALRLRTAIAMLSYNDDFTFGILADYDTAPDLELLSSAIQDGVARLVELAAQREQKAKKSKTAGRAPEPHSRHVATP